MDGRLGLQRERVRLIGSVGVLEGMVDRLKRGWVEGGIGQV